METKAPVEFTRQQNDKLIKARYKLGKIQPFFQRLAWYLKPKACAHIPTMGVDIQGNLFINTTFFDMLSGEDLVWVLAHEVMHLVTTTHKRLPIGADRTLWNIASDIAINKIITDMAKIPIVKAIKPLYGPEFDKYDNWTTEKIYYDLVKECKKAGKSGSDGSSGDGNDPHAKSGDFKGKWWDGSGAETSGKVEASAKEVQDWKQRIASAKQAGKVSGALESVLNDILEPQRDWRKELRQFVQSKLRQRHTWMRPGRRTAGINIRTPARNTSNPTAIVYMDTSGSMSDEQLRSCLAEVSSIFSLGGGKGRLILGDCEIYYDGEIDKNALGSLKMRRGGTDFTVLFKHIDESEEKRPKILVGFTDAYGPFPASPPDYPVIWVTLKGVSTIPPWGHHIEINA